MNLRSPIEPRSRRTSTRSRLAGLVLALALAWCLSVGWLGLELLRFLGLR